MAYVQSRLNKERTKIEKLLNENEKQTKKIAIALKDGNESALIEGIKAGERTLEKIGVVSRKAIRIIRMIEATGGAVKILGGGGRAEGVGFLLGYHHNPEILVNKYQLIIKKIRLGEEGIRLEKSN